MKIGIFGGSFNPIHTGHCILANYIRQYADFDEVWLNVAPQNPLKAQNDTTYDDHRLKMAEAAAASCPGIRVCDIEFSLPRPSYTIRTLEHLQSAYPQHRFRLIIGSDNWLCFSEWKDHKRIVRHFGVSVYPRPGYPAEEKELPDNVQLIPAPQIDISSTFIREGIRSGKDMSFFLPEKVYEYIKANKLYRI